MNEDRKLYQNCNSNIRRIWPILRHTTESDKGKSTSESETKLQGWRLTFQLASPEASEGFDPLAKTIFSLARRRALFSFKIPIHDFHEQNNSFHLNSIRCKDRHRFYNYYIGLVQQRKPKFSLPGEIVTELVNSPPRNISFYQNADSRFLVSTIFVPS